MKKSKKLHLRILLIWPLVAAVIALAIHSNYFEGAILFFGLPGFFLATQMPRTARRVAFLVALALPIPFIADYIAHVGNAWYVGAGPQWRILNGVVPWVDIVWFFLWLFCILMVWEYFFDDGHANPPWSKRTPMLARLLSVGTLVFLLIYLWAPQLLVLPYAYLFITLILALTPVALEIWHHPKLAPKMLWISLYFGYSFFIHELVALQLGYWIFPGTQFIGWIQVFRFRFPIEEGLTFILLGAATCICCYEYFLDDDK